MCRLVFRCMMESGGGLEEERMGVGKSAVGLGRRG